MRDRATSLIVGFGGSSMATLGIMSDPIFTGQMELISLAYMVIGFAGMVYCIWTTMGDDDEQDR